MSFLTKPTLRPMFQNLSDSCFIVLYDNMRYYVVFYYAIYFQGYDIISSSMPRGVPQMRRNATPVGESLVLRGVGVPRTNRTR